jgi:hypothetical protein
MRNRSIRLWGGISSAVLLSGLIGVGTGLPAPKASDEAQVAVTVRARRAGVYPDISLKDLTVIEDKQKCPVVSWVPAKEVPGGLDLTVLVDDSLLPGVSHQFKNLADFFPTLPEGTRIRIVYAAFNKNHVALDFTTNYALASKALRAPAGSAAIGGSLYQAVEVLIKKWPVDGRRRELILISNGIDTSEGTADSAPQLNSTLDRVIKRAQSSGISIYTIFAQGAAGLETDELLLDNGQGCLLRLTAETGGRAFFQGGGVPLDFTPFLKNFAEDIDHQYVLKFQPSPDAGKGLQPLHITTHVPGVDLVAPPLVYISKDEE